MAGGLQRAYAAATAVGYDSLNSVYIASVSEPDPDPPRWKRNVWRAIRIRKRVSIADLLRSLDPQEVLQESVYELLTTLVDAGFMREDACNNSNIYTLVHDVGSAVPLIPAQLSGSTADSSRTPTDARRVEQLLAAVRQLQLYPEIFYIPKSTYPHLVCDAQNRRLLFALSGRVSLAIEQDEYLIVGSPHVARVIRELNQAEHSYGYIRDLIQWHDTLGRVGSRSKQDLKPHTPFPYPATYPIRRVILTTQRRKANRLVEHLRRHFLDRLGSALYGHRPGERIVELPMSISIE